MNFQAATTQLADNLNEEQQLQDDDEEYFDYLFAVEGEDDDESNDTIGDDIFEGKSKKQRWNHVRNSWRLHLAQLQHEGMFKREYRMSHESWTILRTKLQPTLMRRKSKSRCTHPMEIDIIMSMGLDG